MAYSKKPTYSFENETSYGINKVPKGRLVLVESYEGNPKSFIVTKDTSTLTDSTTLKDAVTKSFLGNFASSGGGGGGSGGNDDPGLPSDGVFEPGALGFGVGVASDKYAKDRGLTGLPGFRSVQSDNYGNYIDKDGNIFVFIPKFYFKWTKNEVAISREVQDGYVVHRAFINAGQEIEGFFIGKYQMSDGTAQSVRGKYPWGSAQGHQYYKAAKDKGSRYTIINVFMFNALAIISKCQRQNGRNCAWVDVSPYYPKGNNNSGGDVNDTTVRFIHGGKTSVCGSGDPFAKTTHNGQNNGVADINGNVWEFAIGYTCDGNKFFVIKESTDIRKFTEGVIAGAYTTTQGLWGDTAYLQNPDGFYEELVTTGVPLGSGAEHISFGNGNQQVFPFSTDKESAEYKQCCCGIPLTTGKTDGYGKGTEEFGNDTIYHSNRKTKDLMLLLGGAYNNTAASGVFTQALHRSRTYSHETCSSRLAIL